LVSLQNQINQSMHITGLIIALGTFLIIGIFHPIVIKTEYYFGTRPWWLFLLGGIACIFGSLAIENTVVSAFVGVLGASLLWSIGEIFSQKKRVEKGWFPMNPKRRNDYERHVENDERHED
jgi:peptidoglycan/LPS O-acetylase OafA/YrhL